MHKIANLSDKERSELFSETASKMHTTNAIAEKDFWVVWVLDKLFSHEKLSNILMFKGGTSLSKIYGLIERFSEDIDLILDWDLLTKDDPYAERSKTQQGKFNISINEKAKEYIKDELLPIVSEILKPRCKCKIEVIEENDAFIINVQYPTLFSDVAILPHILLEIGPLALWLPSDEFEITPFAAKEFPQLFEKPTCKVKAILAERTFWEKATILHQQANRAEDNPLPHRYSRHYYDLAMMANSEVKSSALADLELLKGVVEFKKRFYTCNWAKYDEAKPGTFKLLPPEYLHKELKEDYKAMQNMIFGKRIDFEEIISILKKLENEINSLEKN
ncbi:MAG: nucleotidyl transferase AbiEii/AbiGii toxin family protein [Candidatus Tenebribacter mawsonii]|nr:nucleotidyl transferase AbiEii/AbiGii toxin family protein [Candidatus Tenebribacter mawsonii]